MKKFISMLALLLAISLPVFAQTSTTSTTLSAAISSTSSTQIHVTSATGFTAGYICYVNGEAMRIRSVSSTTISVVRGVSGTRTALHASGDTIYVGPAANGPFRNYDPNLGSACTAANEAYLPQISLESGNMFTCTGSNWIGVDAAAASNTFVWPDSGEADGVTTATDNVLVVYRIYVPQSIFVETIKVRGVVGTDSGSDDTLAAAIYEDADAGTRLSYAVSSDFSSTADASIDVTDVYIGPGMYRFAFCAQDVSGVAFHANTVDDEFVDVANLTTVIRGTGANSCSTGTPPTTTGAISTSDEHSIVFKLE